MLEAEWKIRVDERDKAISRLQTDYNDLSQQFSKARMEVSSFDRFYWRHAHP